MKKIAILGASGSIGKTTIQIIKEHQEEFKLVAVSVYSNITYLKELLSEFKTIEVVGVKDLKEVEKYILDYPNVLFYEGNDGLNKVATSNCDLLVNALVGFVGLVPTVEAIKAKIDIALANKETLVVAGKLVTKLAKENNVKIYPIDSEHSAIFQCLESENPIKKVILTASGGPFLNKSFKELETVTVEDALNHPNWKMGKKITIDSATLMNKAFEIVEAKWLFDLKPNQIEVVIHPQSKIHSMVEFRDGSIKAQLGISSMKIPVSYALTYPKRLDDVCESISFTSHLTFDFYPVDTNRFEAIKLAYDGLLKQGTYFAIMNASNEVAVEKFLNKEISFVRIIEIVKETLKAIPIDDEVTLESIIEADKKARVYARRLK